MKFGLVSTRGCISDRSCQNRSRCFLVWFTMRFTATWFAWRLGDSTIICFQWPSQQSRSMRITGRDHFDGSLCQNQPLGKPVTCRACVVAISCAMSLARRHTSKTASSVMSRCASLRRWCVAWFISSHLLVIYWSSTGHLLVIYWSYVS